ncbi:putative 60S ribosomal protein L7a-1 [Blattamonas nauphoetae]|uniref:60S ribosomal protein L7a n=1 Tax=Blattamonas nauphoetae TaxID=2049346 RepID=A0ABQ9X3M5_9EUKA|nr:putative 60S ribosomal protein L7a-1 [Blattamonas nauphoetae]
MPGDEKATKTQAKPAQKPTTKGAAAKGKTGKQDAKGKGKNTKNQPKKDQKGATAKQAQAPKKQTTTTSGGAVLPPRIKAIGQPKEKVTRKTPAALPAGVKSSEQKAPQKEHKSIHIKATPRVFSIGGDLRPKQDLSRMVKWPAYIRLQRQKKIMYQRLKIPAMVNQFTSTLDKHNALSVFQLVKKYRPETLHQKRRRLVQEAKAKKDGKPIEKTKPYVVKYGVNHVAQLVEQKKAKLVVIANDVDPIEHVLWLPTLCRKMDVPYCIVKNKARLGKAVHLKTTSCMAFVNIRPQDKKDLEKIVTVCRSNYNDRAEQIARHVGGGKLGLRSSTYLKKRAEALKKASLDKAAL